jgi:hypothetical protein
MAVRNFWIEANIDGHKTSLEGGPRSKDGGFNLTIYIRDRGSIARAVEVYGLAKSNGKLELTVRESGEVTWKEFFGDRVAETERS